MRFVLVTTAALVLITGPALTQGARDCSRAATQIDASQCAKDGWVASDTVLNDLWKVAKPQADAAGSGQQLLTAQRAWLKYRDATCDGERAQYEGGSIAPQVYWSCMDRLTRKRNSELKAMIK